ncbi:MAG: 2Fe-2S iron-sulfur cluster-binding protein, partial [Hoylesella buccalis]
MEFSFILQSIAVFLTVILLLVIILLVAKKYLSPSGNVNIVINEDKTLSVPQGASIMSTLTQNGIYLPSACGGKGSCGQCRLQVIEGGGEILDSERPHFTRKEIKNNWRLGCQCKVKGDLKVKIPETVLGVKEWECTVISNKNVSSFIKEFKVQLPPGEHMDFIPGSYAQISIPAYDVIDYDKDFDKDDIGEEYIGAWKKFNILSIKAHNPEPTVRAYSMANYP